MRKEIELKGLGCVKLAPPNSFVAITDLIMIDRTSKANPAILARVCAALLGICWAKDNKLNAPKYDLTSADILGYGVIMMDWLLRDGGLKRNNINSLYDLAPLFAELWDLVPKDKEVAAEADRFSAGGEIGSGDTGDKPPLEPRA